MDITCNSCSAKFRIPDEKIPRGRVSAIPCPKCKTRIPLDPTKKSAGSVVADLVSDQSQDFDFAEKPFDFMEEDGLTALLCEQNPHARQTIEGALNLMDYRITVAENARDALKRLRYHAYDLIVVNESFDTNNPDANGVLIYLERLTMSVRRNIFVAMISNRYRTMDNMMAFHDSVNLVVNIKNIEDVGKILSRGITDNQLFYNVYRETLKETGRN
ncbi:MAG: zinc-ribbon domain-containing protein [Desulfobacterales bacterium]|jgi:predicted Zn finger-like uncharacterized protein